MFELMDLIALPSLFLLVLCGLYGLTTWFSMQKEKALTNDNYLTIIFQSF